jgi:hypothetical protein
MKKNRIAMSRAGKTATEWASILLICVHPVNLWLAFSLVKALWVGNEVKMLAHRYLRAYSHAHGS